MHRRKLHGWLNAREVRQLDAVVHEAQRHRAPVTVLMTVHLGSLEAAKGDPGAYLRRVVVNRLGRWCRDRRIPWIGVWVRENYVWPHREHVHVLLHVPRGLIGAFEAAVRRWWPSPIGNVERVYHPQHVVGYLSKQMTPQAHFAVGRQIRRERQCRRTGAKVAAVLGRRMGMSRQASDLLDPKT
jgi:hypothetical protein